MEDMKGMSSQKPLIQSRISFPPSKNNTNLKRKMSEDSFPDRVMSNKHNDGRSNSGYDGRNEASSSSDSLDKKKYKEDGGKPHHETETSRDQPKKFNRFNSRDNENPEHSDGSCDSKEGEISDPGSHEMEDDLDNLEDVDVSQHSAAESHGCPLDELPQVPGCFEKELPTLQNNFGKHHVFFITHGKLKEAQKYLEPIPGELPDTWHNPDMVKMPCSSSNRVPNPDKSSTKTVIDRWSLIRDTLKSEIRDSFLLEEAILKYNNHYRQSWNFDALHNYFEKCGAPEETAFFNETLPQMVKLALNLPNLFTKGIPFLKAGEAKKLTFSQQQVACLLANAFFCTFPCRNRTKGGDYPSINFSSLFAGKADPPKMDKIKCIIHYFQRVTKEMPKGVITYERRVLRSYVNWEEEKCPLTKLHMSSKGTIEDTGKDMLQMDFANKFVGGGVLGHGCVQEEIRFLICPEMIVSRLFTEILSDKEVLIMTGCERFSRYTGYAGSFKWAGDHVDTVGRDEWGRKYTEVVAMDALHIRRTMNQFEQHHIHRELDKAYCAFLNERANPATVCTGNWGCGAFGGDAELKAVIQIMAASKAKRDVCYLTVGDERLCRNLSKIHASCREYSIKVGDLFKVIMDYSKKFKHGQFHHHSRSTLLDFIEKNCT